MKHRVFLGIDTSNYTTSFALVAEDGTLIADIRKLLPVKEGACGLRQSDAVFAHIKNISDLQNDIAKAMEEFSIAGIGVSSRPRNHEGSYMPCFLTGVAIAETLASVLHVPLFRFSHQCGHIMAAMVSCPKQNLEAAPFAAFHISGGTTELMTVSFTGRDFETELVGGTKDVHAGQLVDRIGVMLGLPFPSGNALEQLAMQNQKKLPKIHIKTNDCFANFSGIENQTEKIWKESGDPSFTAAFLLQQLGQVLSRIVQEFQKKYGAMPILYAGGVMRNLILRETLSRVSDAYFAQVSHSSDNAIGIAHLAKRCLKQ